MIDTILYNGNIITRTAMPPRAQAVAFSYGRIVAIGNDDEVLSLATAATRRYDLNGKTILPGLTDAHVHLEWLARALQAVDLFEVPSKAIALERIAARVETATSDEWITGRGWTQDLWAGDFPTAQDIDAVAPHHPAYFSAKSGHAAWVNSAALRIAGIDAQTPDPPGGEFVRDQQGNPTGLLLETAMEMVAREIPTVTPETLTDYVAHAQAQLLATGITGIHDYDNPSLLHAVQTLRERDQLDLRIVKQINKDWLEPALASGIHSHFGDDWIRFGCLKLFADGALGPRTAHMIAPYEGQPHNTGIPVLTQDEMYTRISKASAQGLASTVHAIGDQAVRIVLDIFQQVRAEEAQRGVSRHQRRHRIEHVQVIHPDDVHRLAALDLIASMQPIHATSDWQIATQYWGEARSAYAYNARMQIDHGAKIAFGSDAPVEPFDPFKGIHAAVTRQRAGQPEGGWFPDARLTLDEALHGFTGGAAYAAGMEDRLGKLAVGYLADCIVIDRDPYAIAPDDWLTLDLLATIVGGRVRYGDIG